MRSFVYGIFITLCAGSLAYWMSLSPGRLSERVPIPENDPSLMLPEIDQNANQGTLIAGSGKPSSLKGVWPQFRGEARDNVARGAWIVTSWPETGPKPVWTLDVGEGHAGVAIRNGCVYLVDYDEKTKEDVIRCLSFDTGEEIWRYTYYVKVKRNHGMSRTVPAVTDKFVVTLGPMCHIHCLDAKTGELVWKKDLVREYGTKVPEWYAGQCPLIDGDKVILAPGGKSLLTAIDPATGNTVGETPNPNSWQMTHTSVLPIMFEGKRQYVSCTTGAAVGIDGETWEVLWTLPEWKMKIAVVPSPVDLGNGRIFFTMGYDTGGRMIQLVLKDGRIIPETVFTTKALVFGSDQHTPVYLDGNVYGVIPGGKLACLSPEGKQLWVEESFSFGLGPYMAVGDKLLVLQDNPVILHIFDVGPEGATLLASYEVIKGLDAWAPMAFADGRLVLRDTTKLACFDLR